MSFGGARVLLRVHRSRRKEVRENVRVEHVAAELTGQTSTKRSRFCIILDSSLSFSVYCNFVSATFVVCLLYIFCRMLVRIQKPYV